MDKWGFILTDSFAKFIFYPHCLCVGLFQPQAERVAIEALQICTVLLPPSSRRKLQLLMRMMCRISQNVDMPRLHPAIGTRTLVRPPEGQQMHLYPIRRVFLPAFSGDVCILALQTSHTCCSPPQDGAHILRLHPRQRCGVWSGWAAGYQAGFISSGSPRTYPGSPRVPAQCYKQPHTAPTHSPGEFSAPQSVWSTGRPRWWWGKCWDDSTFTCYLALLTRSPSAVRLIKMAVIRLRFPSPFTPSAIKLAALSLNSRSWRPPRKPWRSCWRCSWQTKI